MVQLKTASIGSYPRVGDDREEQKLRRAISRYETDEISEDELKDVQHEVIREVIDEQETAGVDQVTDGQIRWYCPFSHMVRKMNGTDINGLVRYFDTNFYFRQPLIHESPERNGSITGPAFEVASSAASTTVRSILTGPFTLAKYSIPASDDEDLDLRTLANNYAAAIAEEIRDLSERGAEIVQLEEHGLRDAESEEQKELFLDALRRVREEAGEDVTLSVAFSYGSPIEALPLLEELAADEVVLDLVYEEDTADELTGIDTDRDLVLGVVNARNTKLEDPETEADRFAPVVESLDHDQVTLSPSTGLELLPRDRAQDKLSTLVDIKQELQNTL